MLWEDFINHAPQPQVTTSNKRMTTMCCPRCGETIYMRTDKVMLSYPVMYQYECIKPDCDWIGYSTNCWED